jgi:hypothetical protein
MTFDFGFWIARQAVSVEQRIQTSNDRWERGRPAPAHFVPIVSEISVTP